MYIEPNSKIIFLQNCPLDNTYQHTLYFENSNKQYEYFYKLKKHTLSQQMYQRVNKGMCRVQFKAEDLYNCNYMMFQNTSFGEKWFYAFVTKVEYISNIVSEVSFELDVMQTWFFDYTLKESFVEREHSITDNFGENVITENVELGEYINKPFVGTGLFDEWKIVVASEYNAVGDAVSGHKYGGIYCGVNFYSFSTDYVGISAVNEFILGLNQDNKQDGIVAIYVVPSFAIGDDVIRVRSINREIPTSLYGYTPRNKKLLTYPYNFEMVTTYNGEHTELRYELFTNNTMTFSVCGDVTPSSTFLCTPMNYMFNGGNFNNSITLDKLPLCVYTTDAYLAWLAQNKNVLAQSTAMGLVSGTVATIGGIATGNIPVAIGGGLTIASSITNVMAQNEKAQAQANPVHGTASGVVEYALGILDFHFSQTCVKDEFARSIDDYFDMFGYATKRVKIPNINSRPHWNYVQTIGCNLIGSCPSDDIAKIKKVYDNGITFWKNGDNVGNYSLDNSPQ